MKYNEGDLVTIKLNEDAVIEMNDCSTWIRVFKECIVKHEPAPFDWSKVKPGMAFKTDTDGWEIVWFMCVSPRGYACVTNDKEYGMADYSVSQWTLNDLTRVPEHDIEVTS